MDIFITDTWNISFEFVSELILEISQHPQNL